MDAPQPRMPTPRQGARHPQPLCPQGSRMAQQRHAIPPPLKVGVVEVEGTQPAPRGAAMGITPLNTHGCQCGRHPPVVLQTEEDYIPYPSVHEVEHPPRSHKESLELQTAL